VQQEQEVGLRGWQCTKFAVMGLTLIGNCVAPALAQGTCTPPSGEAGDDFERDFEIQASCGSVMW